ncbi:MAG: nucleotide exchange factor GrpE, partial [Balneolaceae bacterium]
KLYRMSVKNKDIKMENLDLTNEPEELEKGLGSEVSDEVENNENNDDGYDLDSQLIEDQQHRIRELEEEMQSVKETQLRKAAEMDNMRKRLNREREMIFQAARESAVMEFLPISDDLLRTLDAMEQANADPSYLDGMKMVISKFDNILAKYDVKRIDETGVPFDVDLHDAMLRQKSEDESVDSGIVLNVIENGYQMGGKTLRHAKVIVSE